MMGPLRVSRNNGGLDDFPLGPKLKDSFRNLVGDEWQEP